MSTIQKLYKNRDWLKHQYIDLKKSTLQIASEFEIGRTTINTWLEKLEIPIRSTSEALKGRKLSEATKKKIGESQKGEKNWRWMGGRKYDHNKYIEIYTPNHPNANTSSYVYEHRLVMEKYIGRYLTKEEKVHHINGVKDDNRIENLIITSQSNHRNLHHSLQKCGYEFFKLGFIKFDKNKEEYYIPKNKDRKLYEGSRMIET